MVTIPLTLEGHYTVTEEQSRPGITCSRRRRTQHADVEYNKTATVTFTNAPYGSLRVEKAERHRRRPLRRHHPDQAHRDRGDPHRPDPERRHRL